MNHIRFDSWFKRGGLGDIHAATFESAAVGLSWASLDSTASKLRRRLMAEKKEQAVGGAIGRPEAGQAGLGAGATAGRHGRPWRSGGGGGQMLDLFRRGRSLPKGRLTRSSDLKAMLSMIWRRRATPSTF